MSLLWLVFLIFLVLWLAGSYAPFSPVRGDNRVHLLLLVLVIILIVQWQGGGGFPRWHR